MVHLRVGRAPAAAAFALVALALIALPAAGQTFVELNAGWNFVQPTVATEFETLGSGLDLRGSIGRMLGSRAGIRIDAGEMRYRDDQQFFNPCPSVGPCAPFHEIRTDKILAFTANGLVNLDRRGIVYLIGGAGAYDTQARVRDLRFGASAGAGLAIPIGSTLRLVVESAWHALSTGEAGPRRLVPITVGLRF